MSSSKTTSRDIRRLASLYNGVAMVQLQALCFNVCASVNLRHDNKIEIWAQQCQKPTSQTPIFGDPVPERLRRTFVSINKCIAVIVYNSGWLAHCLERLNIDVKTLELDKPKRVHGVLVYLMPGDKLQEIGYNHFVLLLIPRSGGQSIVADASHAQYSFDRGIDMFEEFKRNKVCDDSSIVVKRFGFEHERVLADFTLDKFSRTRMLSTMRITNRAMFYELENVGGIKALLDLSPELFEEAQESFLERIKVEMDELKLRLEEIRYEGGVSYSVMLRNLGQDCDGEGHQTCLRSLERNHQRAVAGFGTL